MQAKDKVYKIGGEPEKADGLLWIKGTNFETVYDDLGTQVGSQGASGFLFPAWFDKEGTNDRKRYTSWTKAVIKIIPKWKIK
jgi:hypothetical protein